MRCYHSPMQSLSMTHEDYLEAILMLAGPTHMPVRAVDVANKMNVSKTSVNKAVTVLKEKGFVEQERYGDLTLTADGVVYGSKVLDRHLALTRFLNKALGIDAEIAEEEACQMEHAISDDSFEKWLSFIDSLNLDSK